MVLDTSNSHWTLYGFRIPAAVVRDQYPDDTASQQTAKTAMRWIYECTSSHSICSSREATVLPTRLIDVATLQLSETAGKYGIFACLSHCWGEGNHALTVLRTTKANIASMKEGLPWEKVPRTFREAIKFTRDLGIPYLWIDSLCIIQDDYLDWEREAAAMADVYTNCLVTIAASLSPNSNAGLFFRGDDDVGSCHIGAVHCQGRPPVPLFMRRKPDHDPRGLGSYPLSSRGWVVQELLLSPRTIHFIGPEILFECQHTMQCECGLAKGPVGLVYYGSDAFSEDFSSKGRCRSASGTWDWHEIVQLYADTSLSFSKDKFPALSGLAKQWLAASTDEYLAGLWRSTLPGDLIWQCVLPGTRARPWRAPSWSWASVEAPTLFFLADINKQKSWFADIVEAHCTPSGLDPTGGFVDGRLTVRGKTTVVSVESGSLPYATIRFGRYSLLCSWDINVWEAGDDFLPDGSTLHLLFMYRSRISPKKWRNDNGEVRAFMLLKSLGGSTYERIGLSAGLTEDDEGPDLRLATEELEHQYESVTEADYIII
jgi:hypothetical protein